MLCLCGAWEIRYLREMCARDLYRLIIDTKPSANYTGDKECVKVGSLKQIVTLTNLDLQASNHHPVAIIVCCCKGHKV